jgi:cytochrome c553
MKGMSIPLSLGTMVALFLSASASRAETTSTAEVSKKQLEDKITYCQTCHGLSAEGYRATVPIPRLAGQQPEYLENQLKAFIERRRLNNFMFNVAHVLSPAMQAALAKHFAELNPKPLGGLPKDVVAEGKKIYDEGVSASDVPPCASCHGPDAKGNGAFPRLAGQLPDYTFNKLVNWSKERGQDRANPDTSEIMAPIAHNLTDSQITAVAAYVSTLE